MSVNTGAVSQHATTQVVCQTMANGRQPYFQGSSTADSFSGSGPAGGRGSPEPVGAAGGVAFAGGSASAGPGVACGPVPAGAFLSGLHAALHFKRPELYFCEQRRVKGVSSLNRGISSSFMHLITAALNCFWHVSSQTVTSSNSMRRGTIGPGRAALLTTAADSRASVRRAGHTAAVVLMLQVVNARLQTQNAHTGTHTFRMSQIHLSPRSEYVTQASI